MLKKTNCVLLTFLLAFLFGVNAHAQKVGVVLSGGGSSALAHIGVLKALEENNIPIDYITGTSMGALVGGLYACGWTPEEIEAGMSSDEFRTWAEGGIEERYQYYFKRNDINGSWISFKFSPDTIFETALPTNFISPVSIDLALMEIFARPAAAANYNFDSLMIPFRCVAADITDKKTVIFKKGQLNQAVRASMSYPFYVKPLKVNGRVLFDGGLYNNFTADVMYQEFLPDIIIGSDVSGAKIIPDEDNLISQLKSMIIARSNNTHPCAEMVVIHPEVDNYGVFQFELVKDMVQIGYKAANKMMDSILNVVPVRADCALLAKKRMAFKEKQPALYFDGIYVNGLNKHQANYVKRILRLKLDKKEQRMQKPLSLEELKPQYFRLASDDKIKFIYPISRFNPFTGKYDLVLDVKKDKKMTVEFGGVFSSKPINTGYVGLQYHYLRNISMTISGNSYFGKLYGSYQAKVRVDLPFRLPVFIEAGFTNSRYDFFKSYATFFEVTRPSYLIQYNDHAEFSAGIPIFRKGRLVASYSYGEVLSQYYQTSTFSRLDTADRTYLDLNAAEIWYERNTLNRKQFASLGSNLIIKLKYFEGVERTYPGSTATVRVFDRENQSWIKASILYQNYFIRSKHYRVGYYLEGVYTNQQFLNNYTASILASPAFLPIPESRTLFLNDFRSHAFGAAGLMNVISLPKNLDLRLEAYYYQPYKKIVPDQDLKGSYNSAFVNRNYIGSAGLVYNSPLGPASLCFNYYNLSPNFDKKVDKYSIIFSLGYILHNKRMLD